MNNYYFTESKWYGPLPFIKLPIEEILNFPSGPSLIPEFAGMVKELNIDFKLINVSKGLSVNITAVPVAEENRKGNYTLEEQVKKKDEIIADQKRRIKIILQERENAIKNLKSKYAEEGKQTFSEEELKAASDAWDAAFKFYTFNLTNGFSRKENPYPNKTEYLKTKQLKP